MAVAEACFKVLSRCRRGRAAESGGIIYVLKGFALGTFRGHVTNVTI